MDNARAAGLMLVTVGGDQDLHHARQTMWNGPWFPRMKTPTLEIR